MSTEPQTERVKSRQAGNRGLGRPRGSANRKTLELRAAVEEAHRRLKIVVPEGVSLDAHALLRTVYLDDRMPVFLRVEAAKSALKVEKPALSAAQIDANVSVRLGIAQELMRANRRLASSVTAAITQDGSAEGPQIVNDQEDVANLLASSALTT